MRSLKGNDGVQITYSYEGEGHELRNDQAALDYCFMLPFSDDSRLFQVDAVASSAASAEVPFLPLQTFNGWNFQEIHCTAHHGSFCRDTYL